jgi:serine/threonine protein kinase
LEQNSAKKDFVTKKKDLPMSKGRTSCVFSWGLGKGGALGHGDEEDRERPAIVLALNGLKVHSVFASGAHTFALSDGQVYAWGLGSAGQLGSGELLEELIPRPLNLQHKIVHISAGVDHTLALSDAGEVFSWGSGSGGKLGHGNFEWYSSPRKIDSLKHKIVSVAAGTDHSLACTHDGHVYSWGAGLFGALGHGNSENLNAPKQIIPFSPSWSVVKFVGAGNSYSVALTSDGKLYSWGSGVSGVLGHKNEQNYDVPKLIDSLKESVVAQISPGRGHVLALLESGEVHSWGNGEEGQLGHGNAWNQLAPKEIQFFKTLSKEKVIDISAGWYHSLALTNSGHIYAWGSAHVHLGAKEKDEDQLTPTLVFGLKQAKVKFITAGYNHSVACGEADADEFLENEISLNTDLSAEHLINTINSTTKTEKRRAAKKLALLCIKTEPEVRKIFLKDQGVMKLLQEFAASADLKWKEDFYKRVSANHLIWEPFTLIKEFPHYKVYKVVQRKKNEKKNKQIAIKILNSSALNLEDLQSDILTLSLIKESIKYVNEFRGYLQVTEENMPSVLKTRKDLPLHCQLFNLADLSLEDLIRSGTKLSDEEAIDMLLSIAKGMCELHSLDVPHYDLRPETVLLKKRVKGYDVKITDYLLGKRYSADTQQKLGVKFYRAPETNFSKKSDVFSFGIMLWECFSRQKPKLVDYDLDGKTIVIPSLELTDVVPQGLHKLIIRCTELDPVKRPDFSLIVMELSKLGKRRK